MHCDEHGRITRRGLLGGGAALTLWGLMPRVATAAARDRRFLLIVLRGGLDGLSLVAPVGDPNYAAHRGRLALSASGDKAGLALDGFFVLNPAMPFLHGLYARREALLVHAVASAYRGRSHFDGQDVLESGFPAVGGPDTGWLNRALLTLPSAGPIVPSGLTVSPVVPLVMRGPASVVSWSQPTYADVVGSPDTLARLMRLYEAGDPALARALGEAAKLDGLAGGVAADTPSDPAVSPLHRGFIETARVAARLMSAADGPRIGTLSYDGWDTHANEGARGGTLYTRLGALDLALKAFAEELGTAWKDAVVAVVTEFGRTVRANGTDGTDHGTATAAILAGGAVAGGRLLVDWPGLAEVALYEGRDLKPTLDLRAVMKGLLADHLAVPEQALARDIFPDSGAIRPLTGLVRA